MMKTPTDSYWINRSRQRMAYYHKDADKTIAVITKAYDKAIQDIDAEIIKIFNTFSKDGKMDPAKAKRVLNQQISNPLLDIAKKIYPKLENEKVKRWLLNKMNSPAYRARITRLQALKEQIYLQSKIIADVEITASTAGYVKTMKEAYYRTMFDVQKGLGIGFEFASMSDKTIQSILKNPWSGEHFSKRIWNNTDVLAGKLTEVITAGFMSGVGIDKMANDIEYLSDMGKHAANRLVRTETTYMANSAELESYQEADIDQYIYVATLDNRTSDVCREHDRKVYSVKDSVPGENIPPLHPYCRSTTRAYFGEETLKNIQRRARDPKAGETYLVPADTSYSDWRKSLENKYGKESIDVLEKKTKNDKADKEQYDRYKEILGKDTPKSFAAFQELKYNRLDEWEDLKGLYRYISNNTESNKTYYEINKVIQELITDGKISKTIGTAVKPISVEFDTVHKHASKRMVQRDITEEMARSYINNATVMFKQNGGAKNTYYSAEGSASIVVDDKLLVTAFPKERYDDGANAIMEVLKKHGK